MVSKLAFIFLAGAAVVTAATAPLFAQRPGELLEQQLLQAQPDELFRTAAEQGNAARGAILFHGNLMGCGKCHSVRETGPDLLGPNLTRPRADQSGAYLVNAILRPSEQVAEEYQLVRVVTEAGRVISGMAVGGSNATDRTAANVQEPTEDLVLRNLDTLQDTTISRDEIVQQIKVPQSVMPVGLTQSLTNVSEFYDLLNYVIEIRQGGARRARELQPTSAQLAIQLPEYESRIDHAGMIRDWDDEALERGREIYMGLCVNCHGTRTAPGSLATALRFGQGQFKHGQDPYSMYQTLTRGAGLMMPQTWMVPQQKYDVIHFLREEFLASENRSQYLEIDEPYLAGLPVGDERGPEPRKLEPWSQADYGPRLVNTYEIGGGARNIAQKGIAVQLDRSPGGVAHGRAWAIFDHDTLRVAGVWTSGGFIDWQGIHFDGKHGIHPHVVGDILLANSTGPGWAHPESGTLEDRSRVLGRDGRWYGPLPRAWGQFKGFFQVGRQTVVKYRVGTTDIREAFEWFDSSVGTVPTVLDNSAEPVAGPFSGVFGRHLKIESRSQPLQMVVAELDPQAHQWQIQGTLARSQSKLPEGSQAAAGEFDGQRFLEVPDVDDIDLYERDFTLVVDAEIRDDGTLISRAPRSGPWAPGGQTLFVRGGRLCYDVGWVGAIRSPESILDGQPHRLALTVRTTTGLAALWIDGRRVAKKRLKPEQRLEDAVLRIGHTSDDFPATSTLRSGSIECVGVYAGELDESYLRPDASLDSASDRLLAGWEFANVAADAEHVSDLAGEHPAKLVNRKKDLGALICGWIASEDGVSWEQRERQLVLNLPAGREPIEVTVWSARVNDEQAVEATRQVAEQRLASRATAATNIEPSEPNYPEVINTDVVLGADQGGFAVDVLQVPTANPWQARVRTSGLDFFADGDRMAVCTWDGDVWIVSGISKLDATDQTPRLSWRRVAFGLFQPLGLKIIDDTIYLTCRDQLVRLVDRNHDGEVDHYVCINNDHQVTEHFHEFAMGLQTDQEGNFYYAKSARHAKTALVPHHGTLLRVSSDGQQTEILANGFRAANGVCLNPDGSFIVTDQEGHWNPKNRINWVRPGGFYGNMYGYHQITDESDDAMEPPLCWITNRFDRSPAELLWVDSPRWGPFQDHLLNFSYGYGKIYVVPHERVGGQVQGGMCQLPIQDLPTGTMRARFSPFDGQLYVCGLSAWATNQTMQEGGLYRVRYTSTPAAMPIELSAHERGLQVVFSEPLGERTSLDPRDYGLEVWSLKRTKNYGSDHYDQHELDIQGVHLSPDRKILSFDVPDIAPTWSMELRLSVMTGDGKAVERVIHNTIHRLQSRPKY